MCNAMNVNAVNAMQSRHFSDPCCHVAGTVTQVHSLRHFMRWKHPSLYIRELIPSAPEPVFEVTPRTFLKTDMSTLAMKIHDAECVWV
jgi:hypothetical protein